MAVTLTLTPTLTLPSPSATAYSLTHLLTYSLIFYSLTSKVGALQQRATSPSALYLLTNLTSRSVLFSNISFSNSLLDKICDAYPAGDNDPAGGSLKVKWRRTVKSKSKSNAPRPSRAKAWRHRVAASIT